MHLFSTESEQVTNPKMCLVNLNKVHCIGGFLLDGALTATWAPYITANPLKIYNHPDMDPEVTTMGQRWSSSLHQLS